MSTYKQLIPDRILLRKSAAQHWHSSSKAVRLSAPRLRAAIKYQLLTVIMAAMIDLPDGCFWLGLLAQRACSRLGGQRMKSDEELESDVREELNWNPDVDSSDIAVSAKNGVVTLAGCIRSYLGKYEAENAAKRVAGVAGLANDLEIRLPDIDQRPDPDIAQDAVAAIKSQLPISADDIEVVANDGWIALEGRVEWQFQRALAESSVRRIKGVKGVTNSIVVKPRVEFQEIKQKLEDALKRIAKLDASRIVVETQGSEVILEGTVRSWVEREEAERIAWQAPGVTKVEDRIVVSP
jgi:osmotically-inducible protein OsmY